MGFDIWHCVRDRQALLLAIRAAFKPIGETAALQRGGDARRLLTGLQGKGMRRGRSLRPSRYRDEHEQKGVQNQRWHSKLPTVEPVQMNP